MNKTAPPFSRCCAKVFSPPERKKEGKGKEGGEERRAKERIIVSLSGVYVSGICASEHLGLCSAAFSPRSLESAGISVDSTNCRNICLPTFFWRAQKYSSKLKFEHSFLLL